MGAVEVETVLKQVEALLAGAGELPAEAEQAVGILLNVVETLSADRRELTKEVERLRQQLEQKKKAKTTGEGKPQTKNDSDHSSEKHRRDREQKTRPSQDRRSFKDLPIHEVAC